MVGDLPHALAALPDALCSNWRDAADVPAGAAWSFPWQVPCYSPLPQPTICFAPLPGQLEQMRARLALLGPPPYLGLTWRGGTPPAEQGAGNWALYKTLAIAQLGAALKGFRGTFLALQRKPEAGELDAMADALGAPLHDLSELNNDLEAMHALLALIDEYVGVSNTNMHLRAAAGRVARVLIPAPAEWRWMASGAHSPWFPGFAIYRQAVDGNWSAALQALARDVRLA
jgi:hypothetical protein